MNCCINCFESNYLKSIIIKNNIQGNCNYCKSENINIYEASELNIFFKNIIGLYEEDTHNGKSIEERIVFDFPKKAFTETLISSGNIKSLLQEIMKDDLGEYNNILNNPVSLKIDLSDVEETIIKPLSLSWDNFSDEIKKKNRFHFVSALDLEKLKSLFKHFEKEITKGKKFYRARISGSKSVYKKEDMGNPPAHLAKSGRANPEGISYLYLAGDLETTLYEVRASLFDYVSVGTFKLDDNIKVVNLSEETYDIFRQAESETLDELIIHKSFIRKLEEELSKPRRRSDSELDYLPTQYLSELIKSMGCDGIEFKSSLNKEGLNLVIFNPEKFRCIEVKLYDIENIKLSHTETTP
jgi:hypothetical protein